MKLEELNQEVDILIAECQRQEINSEKSYRAAEKDAQTIALIHRDVRSYLEKLNQATKILTGKMQAWERKPDSQKPKDPNACVACQGSGKDSKGAQCSPCKGSGQKTAAAPAMKQQPALKPVEPTPPAPAAAPVTESDLDFDDDDLLDFDSETPTEEEELIAEINKTTLF
jgi:hypothetical protein